MLSLCKHFYKIFHVPSVNDSNDFFLVSVAIFSLSLSVISRNRQVGQVLIIFKSVHMSITYLSSGCNGHNCLTVRHISEMMELKYICRSVYITEV